MPAGSIQNGTGEAPTLVREPIAVAVGVAEVGKAGTVGVDGDADRLLVAVTDTIAVAVEVAVVEQAVLVRIQDAAGRALDGIGEPVIVTVRVVAIGIAVAVGVDLRPVGELVLVGEPVAIGVDVGTGLRQRQRQRWRWRCDDDAPHRACRLPGHVAEFDGIRSDLLCRHLVLGRLDVVRGRHIDADGISDSFADVSTRVAVGRATRSYITRRPPGEDEGLPHLEVVPGRHGRQRTFHRDRGNRRAEPPGDERRGLAILDGATDQAQQKGRTDGRIPCGQQRPHAE
jgi:hypothetical protein